MSDRDLGMDRPITRRDFLDGIAVGLGGALLPPGLLDLDPTLQAPYPPALTGLRGAHPGSFEAFHRLRDGSFWNAAPAPRDTGERYDLVVVGAGISGLAAAHYYRATRPEARILVLDNHDDFGGHAKRNEFTHAGRTLVGYGGTQSIDSPAPYSAVARALVAELGIEMERWSQAFDRDFYRSRGLGPGFFFDRETFGVDRLVKGSFEEWDPALAREAPITDAVRRDLERLFTARFDPLAGLDQTEKRRRLARMSYADFLTRLWHLDPGVLPLFQTQTHPLFGVGIDAVPAQDAFGLDLPGFQAMELDRAAGPGQNYDAIRSPEAERYYFHFPDGNAAIARLLVRRLVPRAIPGTTMDDIVTARADYARLDRPGAAVRIRLSSPVLRVRHRGAIDAAREVEVTYLRSERLERVTAGAVVLACWHTTIPYLSDEVPAAQREALAFAIKVPLVYTNVLLRRWTAFERLGVSQVAAPGCWHPWVSLDFPVSLGAYRPPRDPAEPIVLHLSRSACRPGLPVRDQHRVGRAELLATPFATVERHIRQDLGRILGGGGFDPAGDILGITVNRWPHGYAYQYNSLVDDFWYEGRETPCEVARRPFGRIAIANADAGAYSYTDASIDHAWRAAREVLALP